jgi:drug/metabolite transporter (DMT)-like permease
VSTTLLAQYLLGEKVNWRRWAGAGLVACGVLLLGL